MVVYLPFPFRFRVRKKSKVKVSATRSRCSDGRCRPLQKRPKSVRRGNFPCRMPWSRARSSLCPIHQSHIGPFQIAMPCHALPCHKHHSATLESQVQDPSPSPCMSRCRRRRNHGKRRLVPQNIHLQHPPEIVLHGPQIPSTATMTRTRS